MNFVRQKLLQLKYLRHSRFRQLPWRMLFTFSRLLRDEKITIFENQLDINQALPRYPSEYFDRYVFYLEELLKGKWRPLNFYLSVTDRCSSRCAYCYNSLNEKRNQSELSLGKMREVFSYLRENEPTIFQCCITGGEPMLRKDVVEIAQEASRHFFTFLNTSGTGFTDELAKKFKSAGVGIIKVSLDHFDRDFVNKRRGNPLAFDSALAAIKSALRYNLYTAVGAVVSEELMSGDNFLTFVNFLEKMGVRDLKLFGMKNSGKGAGKDRLGPEDEKKLADWQRNINRSRKFKIKIFNVPFLESAGEYGCVTGTRQFCINADGSVTPCNFLILPVGNVNKEPIGEIMARLKECFPQPKRYCTTQAIAGRCDINQLSALDDPEENIRLFKSLPETDLPDGFKKIIGGK